MSLVIKQTRVVEVPVNTISIAATCQQAMLIDADGQCVGSTTAMPEFMPTLLEIDLATGAIKNWCVPTVAQLQAIADGQNAKQATTAPPQAVESAAVTVTNVADCAPPDQQSNPLEIEGFDEPTEADTALCPDVPDSFYAAPAESEPAQQKNAWTPDGRVFLRDLSAVSAHHNLDLPSFYMYQRFGLMTGSKGAIDLTPAGTGLLLMLRNAKKNAEADALVAHFGQPEPVVPVVPDSNVLTIDAPLTLDMLLDAAPAPVTAESVQQEIIADFLTVRGVEPVEPNPMLTPNNIKHGFMVVVGEEDGKWCATCGSIFATSRESVFAAINGCAKKLGLGTCEINALKDDGGQKEEGWYVINDARTKDRLNAYVGGYEVGKGYTARTGKGHKYTAENPELALDGLITHALKVTLPPNAIVQTTDDATVFNDKQRYSIDMSKAVAIVEPTTTDIEDAPEPNRQPARPRYQNPDDHSQTWTGRGKPPPWLQAKLDAGAQLGDYRIATN